LHQFSDGGIAAVLRTAEQHPGFSIRVDHVSDRLPFRRTRLLAAPHGQRDGQLVFARHLATRQVGDRPCKPVHVTKA
jgi:hypothetical protein